MNLRKLNLGLVALLLGFGLVLTQSAFTAKKTQTVQWYLLDSDTGDIDPSHQIVNPSSLCPVSGSKYCAGEFNVEDGEPTTQTETPSRMKP